MKPQIYIGTSGWHYPDWIGNFYPKNILGYNELRYCAQFFNTVENNSSFYRISQESTYKTWFRMTPDNYTFSMKLNKFITHTHRLTVTDEVREKIQYILTTTQVLQQKIGTIIMQLPPNFTYDLKKLETFLDYFTQEIQKQTYVWRVAIEFRDTKWFTEEVYAILKKYNVALIIGQSSVYPEVRHITADFAYIRMHGPEKLFDSKYTPEQLEDWATYIRSIYSQVQRVYVYFNNCYHGYALDNAQELMKMLA